MSLVILHLLFWTSVFYFGCMRKFEIVENLFSDIGRLIHFLSFCHLLIQFFFVFLENVPSKIRL